VKRITFCAVCGGSSTAGAERCEHCGVPLQREPARRDRARLPRVSPLAVLVALALVAALVALALQLTSRK